MSNWYEVEWKHFGDTDTVVIKSRWGLYRYLARWISDKTTQTYKSFTITILTEDSWRRKEKTEYNRLKKIYGKEQL